MSEIKKENLNNINGGCPGGGNSDMPDKYQFIYEFVDGGGVTRTGTIYGMGWTKDQALEDAQFNAEAWCVMKGLQFIRIVGLA